MCRLLIVVAIWVHGKVNGFKIDYLVAFEYWYLLADCAQDGQIALFHSV